jgi:hypothetical protein
VAITIETDAEGDIHPVAYVRHREEVTEHTFPSTQLHDYRKDDYRAELGAVLRDVVKA